MPKSIVDCRGCVYFRFPEELDTGFRDWCRRWIEEYRPGERLLGYCTLYRRPVTYYVGSCGGFKPYGLHPAKPLTRFLVLKVGGNGGGDRG